MSASYLSKTDFRAAYDCETKLLYREAKFPTNLEENEYIAFLAEGGFMVELLAKAKYSGGEDLVNERVQSRAFQRTQKLLSGSNHAVIFEAAALHMQYLARIDILRRDGNTLHIIEVKSSSVRGAHNKDSTASNDSSDEFLAQTGASAGSPRSKWLPVLLDVTFQRMVLQAAFPSFEVKANLCVVDKSALARECETLDKFRLRPAETDSRGRPRSRPQVYYSGDLKVLADSRIVLTRDVTQITDQLMPEVVKRARTLVSVLLPGGASRVSTPDLARKFNLCRKCEYRLKGDAAQRAEANNQHGFKTCWGNRAHMPFHILDLCRVGEIAPRGSEGPVEALLRKGGSSYLDLGEDDLGAKGPRRERRHVQWSNSQNGGRERLPSDLVAKLREHCKAPGYPLHFLDFEACNVALPHHANMRPYERIAFQFSCHTLWGSEDETSPLPASCHRGWLNTEREFPNFKFARELRNCIGERGTVYVWSQFEQTTLRHVARQIGEWLERDPGTATRVAGLPSAGELRDLACWIVRLSDSSRICDLHDLALKHYFHPEMLGRTSIKVVLPAIWRNFGAIHNHPWFAEYLKIGGDGKPLDPYKILPPLPLGENEDDEDAVAEGTGAIRVYQDLIFREDTQPEFKNNRRVLLEQYCRLDTANMARHFSIHEARMIPAGETLDWDPPNPSVRSVRARRKAPYAPITIQQAQTFRWSDFSDLRQANGTFRYLMLEVVATMKTPPAYMALYPRQAEARVHNFFLEDVERLKRIVDCAELAPYFRRHSQHCAACPEGSIFQIPYSAIMNGEFVICVHQDRKNDYWDARNPTVLKRYGSAEELIGDGWLLH